jgi:hypothetical protein
VIAVSRESESGITGQKRRGRDRQDDQRSRCGREAPHEKARPARTRAIRRHTGIGPDDSSLERKTAGRRPPRAPSPGVRRSEQLFMRPLPLRLAPVPAAWNRAAHRQSSGGGAKVGDDREDSAMVVVADWQFELAEYRPDRRLECLLRQPETLRDAGVRSSLRHRAEQLAFARRELDERWLRGGSESRRATTSGSSAEPAATRSAGSRKSSTSRTRSFSR